MLHVVFMQTNLRGYPVGQLMVVCESVRVWIINCREVLTQEVAIEGCLRNQKVDIV